MANFETHQDAARAILMHPSPELTHKSGQFLGGLMFTDWSLTEKQTRWLASLLEKHGLPPLTEGEAR